MKIFDKELSILLVDDSKIKELNKAYLKRNRPTDVIAFPQYEQKTKTLHPQLLGDVVISVETAKRQALRMGHSFEKELIVLLIHGILHLLGYEDKTCEKRKKMNEKQKQILKHLGYC